MNRKILLKLIVCDAALAALTLGYSMLEPMKLMPWTDWSPVFYDTFGGMALAVFFALLLTVYTWGTFQTAKHCRRWQLVMAVNALMCMAAGVGVGWMLFYFAWWLNMLSAIVFMRIMFWTGLLAIALSFPLKRLRRKGLVV